MPSFANSLEKTLHAALANAAERSHEYATLEHLLLALIDDPDAAQVMTACGVDLGDLTEVVKQYLDQEYQSLKTTEKGDPAPTAGFQRVIQRAILHVQSSGKDTVTGANVLVALFSERDSYAVYFLQQQDMSRLDAVSFISHGIGKGGKRIEDKSARDAEAEPHREDKAETKSASKKDSALDQFTVNLNEKALAGKVDPLIGRGPEVDRTIQILCRRTKKDDKLLSMSPLRPFCFAAMEPASTVVSALFAANQVCADAVQLPALHLQAIHSALTSLTTRIGQQAVAKLLCCCALRQTLLALDSGFAAHRAPGGSYGAPVDVLNNWLLATYGRDKRDALNLNLQRIATVVATHDDCRFWERVSLHACGRQLPQRGVHFGFECTDFDDDIVWERLCYLEQR